MTRLPVPVLSNEPVAEPVVRQAYLRVKDPVAFVNMPVPPEIVKATTHPASEALGPGEFATKLSPLEIVNVAVMGALVPENVSTAFTVALPKGWIVPVPEY